MKRKISIFGFIKITYVQNTEWIGNGGNPRYRIYLWGIKIYDNNWDLI